MQDWRTTISGIAALLCAAGILIACVRHEQYNVEVLGTAAGIAAVGIGLIKAKDS